MKSESSAPERPLLVIRGGAVGDFVLTLPVLRLLRESIPGAVIHVMGNRGIVEMATASGHADDHLYLDTPGMALMFAKGVPVPEALAARLGQYKLVLSYLYDPDLIFREQMEKAGVKTFLDLPHRVVDGHGHAVDQLARPLERLAMFLPENAAPIWKIRPDISAMRVAIHPGSGSIHKNWAVEHWTKVGRLIVEQFPSAELVVITGEAERERGVVDLVRDSWRGMRFVHWDALPLSELANRLGTCSHFLGHDSGISHLAAACGVPCHVFFGPTDPDTWAPRGPMVKVHKPASCKLDTLSFEDGWACLQSFLQTIR